MPIFNSKKQGSELLTSVLFYEFLVTMGATSATTDTENDLHRSELMAGRGFGSWKWKCGQMSTPGITLALPSCRFLESHALGSMPRAPEW